MGVVLREDSLATLGAVHLGAMRQHDRKAVLLHRDGERWEETPDWRLDRHVIRLGLYLRERAGVEPGQRVIIASPLRREWLLADLAAVVQGAVAIALDPGLALPELALALTRAAPRAVFVSGEPMLDQLRRAWRDGGFPSLASVISFDGPLDGAAALSEVLDLGGTLDTAERAVAFRARARESPRARATSRTSRATPCRRACASRCMRLRETGPPPSPSAAPGRRTWRSQPCARTRSWPLRPRWRRPWRAMPRAEPGRPACAAGSITP